VCMFVCILQVRKCGYFCVGAGVQLCGCGCVSVCVHLRVCVHVCVYVRACVFVHVSLVELYKSLSSKLPNPDTSFS
jgi:hypothetical protein